MTVEGTVRAWHDDEGWGVIDCPATPGGCWAHASSVLVSGYPTLEAGQRVELLYEAFDQDGYSYRAVELWPAGQDPYRQREVEGPGPGYGSTMTVTFDHSEEAEPT